MVVTVIPPCYFFKVFFRLKFDKRTEFIVPLDTGDLHLDRRYTNVESYT